MAATTFSALVAALVLFSMCNSGVVKAEPVVVAAAPDSCASLGPQEFTSCFQASINEWVMKQQTAVSPTGMLGATCATVSPDSRQACINNWILQHLVAPGTVGGCAGLSPDSIQSCLNSLVLQKQQELEDQQQQQQDPVVGGSCSTVSPGSLQACLNAFVQRLQVAADEDNNKIACSLDDQPCLNAYVLSLQQQGAAMLGGCAGVAPEVQQACINNYVLSLQRQQAVGSVVARLSAAATSVTQAVSTAAVAAGLTAGRST